MKTSAKVNCIHHSDEKPVAVLRFQVCRSQKSKFTHLERMAQRSLFCEGPAFVTVYGRDVGTYGGSENYYYFYCYC